MRPCAAISCRNAPGGLDSGFSAARLKVDVVAVLSEWPGGRQTACVHSIATRHPHLGKGSGMGAGEAAAAPATAADGRRLVPAAILPCFCCDFPELDTPTAAEEGLQRRERAALVLQFGVVVRVLALAVVRHAGMACGSAELGGRGAFPMGGGLPCFLGSAALAGGSIGSTHSLISASIVIAAQLEALTLNPERPAAFPLPAVLCSPR